MTEKQRFLQNVTVLCDSREQKNAHVLTAFDGWHIRHETRKLDFGDYSFEIYGRSFEFGCIIERKASTDELWRNITTDRPRFEKEIDSIHRITGQPILLLENIETPEKLREYRVSDSEMQRQNRKIQSIGVVIHQTLESWTQINRYNLRTIFVKDPRRTAAVMLEIFYYHWHNYNEMTKPIKCKNNPP